MRIILDTTILIRRPDILSKGGTSVRFLLPRAAQRELATSRFGDRFQTLIEAASRSGRIAILPDPPEITLDAVPSQLSTADLQILGAAIRYKESHQEQNVIFASDDIPLRGFAKRLGFKTLSSRTIDEAFSDSSGSDIESEVIEAEKSVGRQILGYFIWGILGGAFAIGAIYVFWIYRDAIFASMPKWGLFVFAAFSGVALFLFRSRYRLRYGLTEVFFGVYAAAKASSFTQFDVILSTQFIAGLYIIVRGLDNIENGLKGTPLESNWLRFFKGRNKN